MKTTATHKTITGYDWNKARQDNINRNAPKPTPRAAMNGNA